MQHHDLIWCSDSVLCRNCCMVWDAGDESYLEDCKPDKFRIAEFALERISRSNLWKAPQIELIQIAKRALLKIKELK